MTIVSTMATTKNDRVYVRVNDEIKEDFETVAEYRGLKTSALLHSLIVKTIHEQRELTPLIFKNKVAGEAGEQQAKQSAASTKDAIAVNVRAKNKSKKAKQTLSTRDGEIPLVDEASSANSDDEQ